MHWRETSNLTAHNKFTQKQVRMHKMISDQKVINTCPPVVLGITEMEAMSM